MRKWHRWIGLVAAVFFVLTAFTGVWLECVRFFGEEEALREKLRDTVSKVSAQTPSAEFSAKFAQAQAAVAAKAGNQPLDKITWQLKGDAPTITFYLGATKGKPARKIVVNANTAVIVKEDDYDDDSFILKLHSGEALGDGGMIVGMGWGVALIVMTITGFVIYWRMRPKQATGLKKIFWLFALGGSAIQARADSPFVTDDPEFSPGWEIKYGMTAERNNGGNVWTAPVLDLNYAVVPNVRLNLTLAGRILEPRIGSSVGGFAETEFKVKWRFIDADTNSWLPSIGIAPKIFFPTADKKRGLSDGVWRAQLPLQFGKTIGNFYNWAEVGYQMAFRPSATDVGYYGLGTLYSFNSHLALGTEIFGYTQIEDRKNHQWLTSLGIVYTFNEHWAIKASISRTLVHESRGGPNPSGVFYLVRNF
ncbi:MAG: PepSY domain-containing protein [Verrucomicrobia bacterium]|nr:PepSY domain-containing protein [Verrucomicrobiota bacterium]